uniref:Uncharacterized protein n=1 Tax=uncultured Prevotella sp. TaxID=159272 RepID=A0A6G8F218_9BACT|nr:hypothetical protein Prevot485_3070 [uncultured Prevotella sp.]
MAATLSATAILSCFFIVWKMFEIKRLTGQTYTYIRVKTAYPDTFATYYQTFFRGGALNRLLAYTQGEV